MFLVEFFEKGYGLSSQVWRKLWRQSQPLPGGAKEVTTQTNNHHAIRVGEHQVVGLKPNALANLVESQFVFTAGVSGKAGFHQSRAFRKWGRIGNRITA